MPNVNTQYNTQGKPQPTNSKPNLISATPMTSNLVRSTANTVAGINSNTPTNYVPSSNSVMGLAKAQGQAKVQSFADAYANKVGPATPAGYVPKPQPTVVAEPQPTTLWGQYQNDVKNLDMNNGGWKTIGDKWLAMPVSTERNQILADIRSNRNEALYDQGMGSDAYQNQLLTAANMVAAPNYMNDAQAYLDRINRRAEENRNADREMADKYYNQNTQELADLYSKAKQDAYIRNLVARKGNEEVYADAGLARSGYSNSDRARLNASYNSSINNMDAEQAQQLAKLMLERDNKLNEINKAYNEALNNSDGRYMDALGSNAQLQMSADTANANNAITLNGQNIDSYYKGLDAVRDDKKLDETIRMDDANIKKIENDIWNSDEMLKIEWSRESFSQWIAMQNLNISKQAEERLWKELEFKIQTYKTGGGSSSGGGGSSSGGGGSSSGGGGASGYTSPDSSNNSDAVDSTSQNVSNGVTLDVAKVLNTSGKEAALQRLDFYRDQQGLSDDFYYAIINELGL